MYVVVLLGCSDTTEKLPLAPPGVSLKEANDGVSPPPCLVCCAMIRSTSVPWTHHATQFTVNFAVSSLGEAQGRASLHWMQ